MILENFQVNYDRKLVLLRKHKVLISYDITFTKMLLFLKLRFTNHKFKDNN